jgi:arabinogalactan oligomer/maltooligosaccharide transport system permease protein
MKSTLKQKWQAFWGDIKENPDAMKSALLSFFIMGAGQFRNKQKSKGFVFLGVFVLVILIELLTGGYFYAFSEMSQYAPGADGQFYFIRDYGGIFSKGLWGLLTLGQITVMQPYRGMVTETFNKVIPWLSGDNSITLLGNGLIALVIFGILIGIWTLGIKDAYVTRKAFKTNKKIETGKEFLKRLWTEMFPFIILTPTLIMVLFLILVPFMFSFLLAFTNYTYRVTPPAQLVRWVGFENFTKIVAESGWLGIFADVIGWTFLYAIMASVSCYVLGMIQAMVIESKYVKMKKLWRTILIVPWAIPAMISLMVFRNVFALEGLANQLLLQTNLMTPVSNFLYTIGLQGEVGTVIYWFSKYINKNLTKAIILMVNLWLGAPYFMMLITGVLTTLPKDLYEAAAIDGASKWQSFQRITLPMVIRATLPAIIMTFTFNFNNFGAIYFLTGGGPARPTELVPQSMLILKGVPGATDILISWIYKLSFTRNEQVYNMAAVYSILIFIFIGFISVYNLAKNKGIWEEE